MRKIAIITDSTSDLSPQLLRQYHIQVLPLHVNLGSRDCLDGVDITPEELYQWSDKNNETPKTAAISPMEAENCLRQALNDAERAICFCVSQEMSSCCSVLHMAAQTLEVTDRVFLIDSRNLSTGIGLQILEAAVMAEAGVCAEEIVAHIMRIQPCVRASFVVDTLTYLHRGGRCGGLTAMVGNTLKLHPSIYVTDGKMHVGKKYRGSMDRVISHYVENLEPELALARPERVFITHSGCDPVLLEAVKARIESLHHFEAIYITRAGSVISSHCGPGTLGVLFIAGDAPRQ